MTEGKIKKSITIVVAEDDDDDRILIREAMEEARLANDLYFVRDGEELMEYLFLEGKYRESPQAPLPDLILLDLNMPRKDGREVLEERIHNPDLRKIPVIVLTTSKAEEDILSTYELGISGYIVKPVTFEALVEIMKSIGNYWTDIVQLPPKMKNE